MVYKHIDKPTVSLQQKKKDIQCINCGTYGHTSKYCNFPTTSYGIICYKINGIDIDTIKYLMIQRKDTLCYVEFIRGKYEIENKDYIIKLFERMTHHERELIRQNTFEYLWSSLWIDNKKRNTDYKITREKFNIIKNGYIIKPIDLNKPHIFVDINYIIDQCQKVRLEQEWEFPKGRRKVGEDDFTCAKREFEEESGLSLGNLQFIDVYKNYEEVYLSINKIRYRNVFYLAKHIDYNKSDKEDTLLYNENNAHQMKEVRDVKWMSSMEVIDKIRDRYCEKIEMFRMIDETIRKKLKSI